MADIKRITVDRILRSMWGNAGDFAWEFQHANFDNIETVKGFVGTFLIMTQDRGGVEEWQEYLKDKQESFRACWKEGELLGAAKKRGWLPPMPPVQGGGIAKMSDRSPEEEVELSARMFDKYLALGKFDNVKVAGIAPAYGLAGLGTYYSFSAPFLAQAIKSDRFYYFGQGDIFLCVAQADFNNGVSVGGLKRCDYCGEVFKRKGDLRKGGQPSKYCGKSCANFAYYHREMMPPPPTPNLKRLDIAL